MQSIIEWFNHNGRWIHRILWFVFSVALIVILYPREGKFKYDFQQGRPWLHEDLIAPFDFPIYKSSTELELEKDNLLKTFQPVFQLDQQITESVKTKFESRLREKIESDYATLQKAQKEYWQSYYSTVLDSIYSVGIIEVADIVTGDKFSGNVLFKKGKDAETRPLKSFYTVRTARDYIYSSVDVPDSSGLLTSLLVDVLQQNVLFDEDATAGIMNDELEKISPTRGMVQKGERIISRGDLVTAQRYIILSSLKTETEKQSATRVDQNWILGGQILLALVAMFAFTLFLFFFRKEVFFGRRDFVLVLSTILFMIAITSVVVNLNSEYLFLVPVCLVPVLIRVFYDHNLALFSLFIFLIITGFLVPNSFEFIFLQLITGIITIITIVNLQRRSQFFFTSLMVAVTYSVIYLALQMSQDVAFAELDYTIFVQFLINGILLLLAFPIIYLYEKLFRKVTDVTLMELSDTNNRLLRMLANEAPGTFQHSIMVANLAEEAVRTIGGDPLLVRTGALYHDIGKIDNPQYFTENQVGDVSPHEELSNEESARIIKNHVLHGVDRARRYKLPDQIIDFIRTHHGTGKIGYFFAMAQKDVSDTPVDERLYTYPGPEPFSKETCVLMMSDAVEAASRSLKAPSESNINELVDKIVNNQIQLKQFENADITFKDISSVKEVLKRRLKNMYHVRIDYPAEALK
ncbi:MAG: phosphohydrolase [Marinilabiliales bacterium]|nr:MAG: phosphohydrolase [Marinilabiliales bacterium]